LNLHLYPFDKLRAFGLNVNPLASSLGEETQCVRRGYKLQKMSPVSNFNAEAAQ